MDFTVKLAAYEDMAEAVRVEKETMGDYVYLEDAWHYFNSLDGGLVCVPYGVKNGGDRQIICFVGRQQIARNTQEQYEIFLI